MGTLQLNQEPSAEAMAANLEDFELKLAKQQIADLEQQLKDQAKAHFDELSAVKKGEGVITDPVAHVIELLQSVPAMQSLIESQQAEIVTLAERLDEAEGDKTTIAEALDKALDAARKAATARDKKSEELVNAVRQLENDKVVIADKVTQLKELKALNPKKLQQANKQLQAKNRDLNETIARMKKQVTAAKKALTEAEQQLATTTSQKKAIEKTFKQLHEDVIGGKVTDVLETRGDWQICSDGKRHDLVYIVDTKTEIARPYTRDGMVKARSIPAEMKDLADAVIIKNKSAAEHLDFED